MPETLNRLPEAKRLELLDGSPGTPANLNALRSIFAKPGYPFITRTNTRKNSAGQLKPLSQIIMNNREYTAADFQDDMAKVDQQGFTVTPITTGLYSTVSYYATRATNQKFILTYIKTLARLIIANAS